MIALHLEPYEIDTILNLLSRKIEKVKSKEIDENQIAYVKDLESIKGSIEAQISN